MIKLKEIYMKYLLSLSIVSLTLTMFFSCAVGTPIRNNIESDNNKTYKIDYLFEQDGNKVYRFYDMGNYVYFTTSSSKERSLVTSITTDSIAEQTITIINKE